MQAALGLSQLEQIEKIIQKIDIFKKYKKRLSEIENITFAKEENNSRNVYWQIGIRIKDNSKNRLVKFLKSNGIDTRNFFFFQLEISPKPKKSYTKKNTKNQSNKSFVGSRNLSFLQVMTLKIER